MCLGGDGARERSVKRLNGLLVLEYWESLLKEADKMFTYLGQRSRTPGYIN